MSNKLWISFSEGKIDDLKCLLEDYDVNIDIRNGNRLIHYACANNDLKMVSLLLNQSTIDINIANNDGWTALHFAVRNGFEEIVHLLYTHNANLLHPTKDGSFPIHFACAKGNLNICKILLEKDSSILEIANHNGWRPHHFACCSSDNFEIFSYLCDNYMENLGINKPIAKIQETALHIACGNGITSTVSKLLSYSHIDVNSRDCLGRTSLHLACGNNYSNIINLLLSCNRTEISPVDKFGWTPLHFACRVGNLPVVKSILSLLKGSNISIAATSLGPAPFYIQKPNATPIFIAASGNYKEIVKLLLPYTPEKLYDDNQFKEYLWSCLDIRRPLLSDSIRYDKSKEIKLVSGLLQDKDPLSVILKELNIQPETVPIQFRNHPSKYLRFCRELLNGSIIRKRYRIFIIGNEGVGKNTLVSHLSDHIVNIPMDKEDIGTIFSKYSFLRLAYWKSNDIDFILWKLKGAQSTSPNLDIFMKTEQPASYFIVLNLSNPISYQDITRLLNSIQVQSTPQCVFFIGTHIDTLEKTEGNNLNDKLKSISRSLSGIIRSWSLNSISPRNINIIYPSNGLTFWKIDYTLKNEIELLKLRLLELGMKEATPLIMPLSYATLFGIVLQSKQLGETTNIAFSWDQFCTWGKDTGLKGDHFRDAASYFKLLGELVYFDSYDSIDEEYFIAHPIWLSTLLESMIQLNSSDMEETWKKLGLKPETIRYIRNRILENFNLIPFQKEYYSHSSTTVHPSVWFSKTFILPNQTQGASPIFGTRDFTLSATPSGMMLFLMAALYKVYRNNKSIELKRLDESKWNGFLVSHLPSTLRIIITILDDNIGMNIKYISICYYPLPSQLSSRERLVLSQTIYTLHQSILNVTNQNHLQLPCYIGTQCAGSSRKTKFLMYDCESIIASNINNTTINNVSIYDILPEILQKSLLIPWEENRLVEKFISMTQDNGLPIYRAQFQHESVLVSLHNADKSIFNDKETLVLYRNFIHQSMLLQHKNLIRCYFFLRPLLSIAIEYYQGTSLDKRLLQGNLVISEFFQIALDVTDVLIFLHSQIPPISHGNINVNNIILPPSPQITPAKVNPCKFTKNQYLLEKDIKDYTLVLQTMLYHLSTTFDEKSIKALKRLINTLLQVNESKLLSFQWIKSQLELIFISTSFINLQFDIEGFKSAIDNAKIDSICKYIENGYPIWCNDYDYSKLLLNIVVKLMKSDKAIELKEILSHGCIHPDSKLDNNEGLYLLHYAAKYNAVSSLRILLQCNASPDKISNINETALHYAAVANSSVDMVEILLEYSASPWIKNKYGSSPVMRACTKSSLCVPILLNTQYPSNSLNDALSRTLQLHYHKQEPIVFDQICLLLAQGASFNFSKEVKELCNFMEEVVESILFNPNHSLPKEHLLWGLYSFFQSCPRESFIKIQIIIVSSISTFCVRITDADTPCVAP